MSKSENTRANLLKQAKILFWGRGYSNVSLREIARAAGVDVALVGRYFGSKLNLFQETFVDLPGLDSSEIQSSEVLVENVVMMFTTADRDCETPSPTSLILLNASDPEVGDFVRDAFVTNWCTPLERILGDAERTARFSAAILGMSVVEKVLRLDGIPSQDDPAYARQLRHFLTIACQPLE